MKKAPQPHEDAPRLVVAVLTGTTPEYALWNEETHELKPVYGLNLCENSAYTAGVMPKMFRLAAEDESYHNELILTPLPNTIDEVVLSENPECSLVIKNCKVVEISPVVPERVGCKVIPHPSAPTAYDLAEAMYKQKQLKKLKQKAARNKDPHTLFLFPESDFQPKNLTA